MKISSRELAKSWRYPRHGVFVRGMRTYASAWFKEKGFKTHPKMSYCLDTWEKWPKNIIVADVANFINKKREESKGKSPFPLHNYIHHGLSSQALLFNLLGPLVIKNDLMPLRNILVKSGGTWPSGSTTEFEHEDREVFNEDVGQPTSIDLIIKNMAGEAELCIECKFVEQEFGGCSVYASGDCDGRSPIESLSMCYLHHIGRKYWQSLEEFGFTNKLKREKQCVLANHYQFFRILLFSLISNGTFILLSDERSPVFHIKRDGEERGLLSFLMEFVPDEFQNRVIPVSIQSLVKEIEESGRHEWIKEFEKKYGLI